ncbi:MAG: hypothetical protein JWN04_5217 [Myxococcaceae bacterium]|nr:hypothetical protein [Myxococcaceae bacterium]
MSLKSGWSLEAEKLAPLVVPRAHTAHRDRSDRRMVTTEIAMVTTHGSEATV